MEPQLQTISPDLSQILFAETSEGIFISDAQGHFLEVNPQACEWLGYSRAELLRLSWQDLLLKEDPGSGLSGLAEGENGQIVRTQAQLRRKNGRPFTGEVRLRGLANGRRVAFVRNLDEYRPADETPHPYTVLADHSRDIILVISCRDGRIAEANATATELYGYSREELLNLSIQDLRAPETHTLTTAQMAQAQAQGILFETLHRRKDGSIFPVEVNSKGTILNGASVLISVVRDISERKRAERERHVALEKYRVLFETFPLGISITDERGNLIEVNGESERLLGLARQDHIGRTYDGPQWRIVRPDGTFMPPDEYASVRALKEKRLVENVEMGIVKDGDEITWLNVTAAPIPLEGYGVAIAYGNITERKQMEAEHQAHLHFFASMDRVNRAIQEANDLEQMMSDVLDVVLSIFDCDRAFLVHPCDPAAAGWRVPMERTKPEYPGALALGLEMLMTPYVAETFRTLLTADGPVKFGLETPYPLPADMSERFGFKSLLSMALYPKGGQPWQFGLHQCAYARIWTADEERLFQEIGRRLTDALTSLLQYHDLRDSERRLTEAQRIAHIGYWERDLEAGRMILADEACRIFGLSPQDFPLDLEQWHQRWLELIHPEDRERTAQAAVEAVRDGPLYNVEYRIIRPNGEVRFIHSEAVMNRDESGRARSMLGMMQDITERKRAEEALQESEDRYRRLVELSPDSISIHSQGRIVFVNSTTVGLSGAKGPEELLGKTVLELIHPDFREAAKQRIAQILATGEPTPFVEGKFLRVDGSAIDVEVAGVPFRYRGAPAVQLVVRDITERRQMEEALYLTRFSVEHAADAIYWVDEMGRIVDANETACRMSGYSREELLHLSAKDIDTAISPENWRVAWQGLKAAQTCTLERMHRTKEGQFIPVEVVMNYIDFAGRTLNCAFVRDISERKQAEAEQSQLEEQLRQSQKMESIGRLAGGVAHDFNNLLTVILGYSELMQARLSLSSIALEHVEQIRQSAKRAEALTRQLLAFSRKQMLVPEILDLNELVTNLRKMLERLIREDIVLITVLPPDLRPIKADPGQIEQVIMNLVVNASDAMPTGGRLTLETANVSLDEHFVQAQPETLSGPGVRLTVTDTGCGMNQEIQSHIFEPFFTTKEPGKGTGLGLATVYGIIKQSGGEIRVDSQPGQGSVFSLYLPAHEANVTTSTSPQPEAVVQPGRETILLVEDEPIVRDFVQAALRDYGYTLLEVDHGYQALALAQQEQSITLLLTDVVMPDINGRELAERVKALHPQIKVLFMSGYTDDEVLRHGVQMADAEFIAKPFSPVVLAAKVRAILDR